MARPFFGRWWRFRGRVGALGSPDPIGTLWGLLAQIDTTAPAWLAFQSPSKAVYRGLAAVSGVSWCLGLGWPVRGALGPSGCFSQKPVFWPVPVLALLACCGNRPRALVLPGRACYFPFSPDDAPACARTRAVFKVQVTVRNTVKGGQMAIPPTAKQPSPPRPNGHPPGTVVPPPSGPTLEEHQRKTGHPGGAERTPPKN